MKLSGRWPADDLRRAFVAGAKWWEFESRKATMWPSDQDKAETAAERRYPRGKLQPGESAEAAEVRERGNAEAGR